MNKKKMIEYCRMKINQISQTKNGKGADVRAICDGKILAYQDIINILKDKC